MGLQTFSSLISLSSCTVINSVLSKNCSTEIKQTYYSSRSFYNIQDIWNVRDASMIYYFGYGLSLLAVTLAILIFLYCKWVHCPYNGLIVFITFSAGKFISIDWKELTNYDLHMFPWLQRLERHKMHNSHKFNDNFWIICINMDSNRNITIQSILKWGEYKLTNDLDPSSRISQNSRGDIVHFHRNFTEKFSNNTIFRSDGGIQKLCPCFHPILLFECHDLMSELQTNSSPNSFLDDDH